MSDLLAEAAPPPQRPEPKRDRWGRYVIPHPETGKTVAWTRATTWASSVSDTFGLTKWQLRMSALGLARRPDLLAQVATVTDPDDPGAKKLLDKLADQAKEHAGASTRANLGTALHSFCERHDLGDPVQVPKPWDRDVAAYAETIRAAGLTIDRAHIERIVTVPELLVAGTFDRLVTTDRLMVADLKGLELTTLIPTPLGWTTMAALHVGDEVFDMYGQVCQVTEKSEVHWNDCYRIHFDDGTSIVCDGEHQWFTEAGRLGDDPGVRTADEIRQTLHYEGARPQRQHRVPVTQPLALPDADLPLDPYVFGAWLGDGDTRGNGMIHKPLLALWNEIERRGFETTEYQSVAGKKSGTRRVHGLRQTLHAMGVAGHKHIPTVYLRASQQQRLDLLRGLMDTDGTFNKARGRYCYGGTTDKALAHQIAELVNSLGCRTAVHQHTARGFGLTVEAYAVNFRASFVPFIAKANGYLGWEFSTELPVQSTRRMITAVEPIPTVPTQCISVDSPSSTYLCGEQMIPTHNTGRDLSYSWTEIAIQLALYAHASTIYDPVSETHDPMPEVDQTRALVMHLPVGQATCTLYEVDIAAGWEMAQICGTVRDWRKRKNLAAKFSGADAPSVAPRTVSGSSSDGTPASAPESPLEQYETEPARADRREWITGRVRAISEHPDALATLLRAWPEGIEGFKNGHQHTNPEVVAIAKACAEAERAHRLAFPDRDPVEVEATACVRPDDQQIIELTDRLRTLPPDLLAEVEAEAVTARGIPRMSSGRCTRAQLDQIAELVSAACATAAERRGLINAHLAVLEEKVPRALHGEVLRVITRGRHDEADRLTEWEAERLGEIVDAIGLGLLELGGDGFAAHTDMSRGDLLAAGKAIADELGIDRPKSSADVLGDPVLFAALAAK